MSRFLTTAKAKVCEHRSFHTRVVEIEDSEDENGSSFETPNKLSEDVISEFKAWLRSADGGKLDEKTNQHHGKQVSNLLKVVDDKCDLTPLFDDHLINQKFLEGYAKKEYHPKITQSYLMNLRHFYSFSLTEQPGITVPMKKLISLRDKVSRWSSAFR